MYDQKKVYQDFSGGLNDKTSPIVIKENQMSVLTNATINDRGLLEKAKGYLTDHSPFPNSTDSFIRMLINLKRGTSVDILLMAAQDNGNTNANYKVDYKKTSGDSTSSYIGHTAGTNASFTNGSTAVTGVGTAWLSHLKAGDKIKASSHADSVYGTIATVNNDASITLSANYGGATAANVAYIARIITHKDYVPRSIIFNDKAIITNGSEKPMTYDNTTLNLLTDTDAPRAKFIENHKNRVFMANVSSATSRVFWSSVNDESSWDPAGYEDVFANDNGFIVGIKSFADSLIVLKNNGNLYQIVGEFDQSAVGEPNYIRRVDIYENLGIIAERSPVVHNGYLYFVAQTGLYRMDQRLGVEKVTFNVDNFLDSLNFSLGPSQSKTYTYDTNAQWSTGTVSGVKLTTDGLIKNYFESGTVSDVYFPNGNTYSSVIDASNNIHITYISNADKTKIKYVKWSSSTETLGTVETVATLSTAADLTSATGVSIAIRADGNPGVAFIQNDPTVSGVMKLYESNGSGTWTSQYAPANDAFAFIKLVYSGNDARIMHSAATASTVRYHTENAGVFTVNSFSSGIGGTPRVDFVLNGAGNPRMIAYSPGGAALIEHRKSDDNGVTWSLVEASWDTVGWLSGTTRGLAFIQLLSTGVAVTAYVNASGALKKRNHGTTTTSTVDSGVQQLIGYQLYNDLGYYHVLSLSSTSATTGTEKFYFEDTSSVTNSTTGDLDVAGSMAFSTSSFTRNGAIFSSSAFTTNANEARFRRLSFRAVWTSAEQTDSTLTSWGTYDVSGQSNNGGTVTHEVALANASPASVYTTIVSGAVISSDPTKIFVKARVTLVLGTFSAPEVGSVVLNYTGAGVDAKQIAGTSFNNQIYFAVATTGATANDKILMFDIEDSPQVLTWPVSAFERFKNKLYGGKSTSGDLVILNQGYAQGPSAYSMDAQFKEDFLESIELEKDIGKIYVLYEVQSTGTFTFSYRLDSFTSVSGSTWTDTTVDMTTAGFKEIVVGQKARSIQCRVQNTTVDNQLGVIAFVITYDNLNPR